MNPVNPLPLELIRRDQARVHELVSDLDRRIDLLSRRFAEPSAVVPPPLPEPPPMPRSPAPKPEVMAPASVREQFVPRAEPPVAKPSSSPQSVEPLELRVGTYWMARVGIVILLTGLVFLGNYAYHRIVPLLGPWGKLSLLGFAGVALGGVGAWLERSRESMRNYGRVLLAGGAAAIYYTAYAAHYVQPLRVIESPILGGGLLLALAGAFMWWADRKRSEALALPAVLLAYYTSAINAIGTFTLFSNALLTAAAVFFLVRHRWTRLSFVSLVATYGSYTLSHLNHLVHSGGAVGKSGILFAGLYWVLFTAGVFLAAPGVMTVAQRLAFLTVNNGAFFALAAAHFDTNGPGAFWIFALTYGAVLLGLGAIAARLRKEDRALDGAYLAQGLALVTLGFGAKLTGPQLAVVLAVESAVLLTASRWRHGLLYQIASALCAIGACGLVFVELDAPGVAALPLAGPVVALLLFDAWWSKRLRGVLERFSAIAFGYGALGFVAIAALIFHDIDQPWEPAMFALTACVSLVALRARLPEVAVLGQAFLFLGAGVFLLRDFGITPAPWWNPVPLIVAAIGLMHWWQRQRAVPLSGQVRAAVELSFAAAAVAVGGCWMHYSVHGDAWLVATSAAALGTLLYGLLTRGWALALAGQAFTAIAVASFAWEIASGHPSWAAALAPIINVAITSLLATRLTPERFPSLPNRAALDPIAQGYRLLGSLMLGAWGFEYVTPPWRVAWFAGLGSAALLAGALTRNRERSLIGAAYSSVALLLFWVHPGSTAAWVHLAAILAIPASLRLGHRITGETSLLPEVRTALVLAAMASLWVWITRWTNLHAGAGQLTTAWAVLALLIFAAGLGLRERLYRLGGFAVLALAVGRLFIVDVWRFDTLPRIVSFLALGIVLLALSFVYNRFAETMRRWL